MRGSLLALGSAAALNSEGVAQSGVLFHADLTCVIRQTAAQTLACQVAGNSPRGGQRVFTLRALAVGSVGTPRACSPGAGGRITDALVAAADPYVATSFSLAGSAIFAQGMVTNRRR